MTNLLKLPTPDEVKDELIQDFCEPTCRDCTDYHCPDHTCPVWKAITLLQKLNSFCVASSKEETKHGSS